jgi:hypothetical protein
MYTKFIIWDKKYNEYKKKASFWSRNVAIDSTEEYFHKTITYFTNKGVKRRKALVESAVKKKLRQ